MAARAMSLPANDAEGAVACLHLTSGNAAIYDDAARTLGLRVSHCVREDLLEAARAPGGLDAAAQAAALTQMQTLSAGADAVIVTSSLLGPIATRPEAPRSLVRADDTLAQEAVRRGGRVVVLYALAETEAPLRALFESAAADADATVSVQHVAGAWAAYESGATPLYHRLLAAAADAAFAAGADEVAFGQTSMTPAARHCRRGGPLTSPAAALRVAARHTRQRRAAL